MNELQKRMMMMMMRRRRRRMKWKRRNVNVSLNVERWPPLTLCKERTRKLFDNYKRTDKHTKTRMTDE